MKQARTGILVGLALILMASVSFAENKPAKAGKQPQAADDEAAEFDADAPAEDVGDETAAGDKDVGNAEGGDEAGAEGGLGDICQIDPDACPKISMTDAAKRDLHAQLYAVQQIYALRRERFEVQPYWGFTANDQFVSHPSPGIALNYLSLIHI